MAEVLSQSQIDALLNSMLSGGDENKAAEKQPEKKYRKYDFTSPRKFTKDRIKMLNGIFETYTRVVNSRLNALLRINCEVAVESVEEQRYYEFSNALAESDVLTLMDVEIKGRTEESPVILYLYTPMALSMIDRMLGGEGEMDDDLPMDYNYTDLELNLYETLVKNLISIMGGSWESYVSVDFSYSRTEVNPTLVQLLGPEETVVIVDMKLESAYGSGRLSVCLPGTVLTSIFGEISQGNPSRRTTGEDNSDQIFEKLRDSSLDVVAQLAETQLSLSDIYHLNIGDVVDLGRPKDAPVYLEIGGYNWFVGRIGTYKKNMAVKIDEVCYQAEQRSE